MEADMYTPQTEEEKVARIAKKPELLSINEIYQAGIAQLCNYCHKQDGVFLWSFTKPNMENYTYQLLMEKGWTRCGTYYYKSNTKKSCCKLYGHRLEVARFVPKKDQKKALKKIISLSFQPIQSQKMVLSQKEVREKLHSNQKNPILKIQQSTLIQLFNICPHVTNLLKNSIFSLLKDSGLNEQKSSSFIFDVEQNLKFFKSKPGDNSDYYCNYVMLLYGLNKKLFNSSKYSLIDFSREVKDCIEGLGVIQSWKLIVQRGGYLLFKKVQSNINSFDRNQLKQAEFRQIILTSEQKNQYIENKGKGKQSSHLQSNQERRLIKEKRSVKQLRLQNNHRLKGELSISPNKITFGKITINIVPAQQSMQSFKIYQQYSIKIHHKEQTNYKAYIDFLCLQSLQYRKQPSKIASSNKQRYTPSWDPALDDQAASVPGQINKLLGCYHMKYFLQEKLLAVGVVDILDQGLSSYYFFYNPAFKQYRLGVFSSLIEIEYVRWMRLSFPEFRYYYMGVYVPNSQKMSYKVDYMPCELLCPVTYRFVDYSDQIKAKIQKLVNEGQKDLRLSQEDVIEDMRFFREIEPYISKNIKLSFEGKPISLKNVDPHFLVHILKVLKTHVPVLGKKVFEMLTFAL